MVALLSPQVRRKEGAGRLLGLMRAHDGKAFFGKVADTSIAFRPRCVRLRPFLPAAYIVVLCLVKTVAQACDGISGCFIRVFAKTKREDKVSVRFN